MAAAEDAENLPLSQSAEVTSSRFFRQGLDRRRPSKRHTTLRSFKVKTSWGSELSSQAVAATSSQVLTNPPQSQELSPIPSTLEEHHGDTSVTSNAQSPALEPALPFISSTVHQPVLSQNRGSSENDQSASLTQYLLHEESPCSIVLGSPEAKLRANTSSDNLANIQKTPSPLSQKQPVSKTPLSGPGVLLKTKQSRKRKVGDVLSNTERDKDSWEREYRENNFVRLFNAGHGRKTSMMEITDLDVILTAMEEEALELRNEIHSSVGHQAVKEFFSQMRKSFSETIDIRRENTMLKSDHGKSKSRINKLRKALFDVQQKRLRVSAELVKEKNKWQERNKRQKVLEDFSSFLVKLEDLQKECRKDVSSKKLSKLDYASFSNLPTLLIEGHGLLTAAGHLKYVNESLHKK